MAGIARWGVRGAALGMGALWFWAVLRLLAVPGAGVLEATVAAGGWGLSVLPVHCVPKRQAPPATRGGFGGGGAGAEDLGDRPAAGQCHHGIATPPFGRRIWPVVKAEASEAR